LAHPQYLEPLRKEIATCVEEEGWTKQALDKMELLESAMKESQRLDPIVGSKPLHKDPSFKHAS